MDLLLLPHSLLDRVGDISSCRTEALASQHFLVEAKLAFGGCIPPLRNTPKQKQIDRSILKNDQVARSFKLGFERSLAAATVERDTADVDDLCAAVSTAFAHASVVLEVEPSCTRRKPWISQKTLDTIKDRAQARAAGDWAEERRLHKLVRASARRDRRDWLTELAGSASWDRVRKLKQKVSHNQGRLKCASGTLVASDERAQTFADYLQDVQWAVRPATLNDGAPLHAELPVADGPISLQELRLAIKALREKKATGPDGHPLEFWSAVVDSPGPALEEGSAWLLEMCNKAWLGERVPHSWHLQNVALIYKKGDPADCCNYRPICLLNSAYKIFAMVLLKRLLLAGADDRLSPTQFGFRKHRGTEDALHCARRAIDRAMADRGGSYTCWRWTGRRHSTASIQMRC